MKESDAILGPEKLQGMLGLKGAFGRMVTRWVMKILEIDKVNETRFKYAGENAQDFARDILKDVGVSYEIPQGQMERIPASGGFITVSNHHFGSIDGLILCDAIGRLRPDYKLLTTFLLSLIPELSDGFLPVDNLSGKMDVRSVNSIRTALRHIQDGGAIGFFPAGEVATYQKKGKRTALSAKPVVEDKPWAPNIIKLIKKSALPVIPIYFDGTNSANFHFLGKIHRRLRTVRLIHEVFNKRGLVVKVRIGRPILPEEFEKMDVNSFGAYIRNRTYALEAQTVSGTDFYKSLLVHFLQQHPTEPRAEEILRSLHDLQPDFLRVAPDDLLAGCQSLDDLDRLIGILSDGEYRVQNLLPPHA